MKWVPIILSVTLKFNWVEAWMDPPLRHWWVQTVKSVKVNDGRETLWLCRGHQSLLRLQEHKWDFVLDRVGALMTQHVCAFLRKWSCFVTQKFQFQQLRLWGFVEQQRGYSRTLAQYTVLVGRVSFSWPWKQSHQQLNSCISGLCCLNSL